MDQYLKELCIEIINQNLESEKFTNLLIETGIKLESLEWDMATKILGKGDEINSRLRTSQELVH